MQVNPLIAVEMLRQYEREMARRAEAPRKVRSPRRIRARGGQVPAIETRLSRHPFRSIAPLSEPVDRPGR